MIQIIKALLFFAVFTLVFNPSWYNSLADDDDLKENGYYRIHDSDDSDDDDDDHHDRQRKRNRKRHRGKDHDNSYFNSVKNPIYETACGECHFLYQPELLPSQSWMKILNQLDDHFGEEIEIDPDSKKSISDYLKSNGAENSLAKPAVKIIRSLGNQEPMRITDIPYIHKKHRELNPEVLHRESIGSLSNCIACHTSAEEGIYEDDNVKIPQ